MYKYVWNEMYWLSNLLVLWIIVKIEIYLFESIKLWDEWE